MTLIRRSTYPPAPRVPHDDIDDTLQVLTNGDRCDRCSVATAWVRVVLYRDPKPDVLLHFCAHHWREVEDKMWRMKLDGLCSIRDERRFLGA